MNGMDNRDPAACQCHVFQRMQVGMDDLGLLLPDQGFQLAHTLVAGA